VNISKEGSTIRGLMDSVALLTSVALQYGVPLRNLVEKFRGVHFEPAGMTSNAAIPVASSLVDYIFRWMEMRFLAPTSAPAGRLAVPVKSKAAPTKTSAAGARAKAPKGASAQTSTSESPAMTSTGLGCPECGQILYFSESCFICRSCGYTRC
jgi:ribonucleoside-diphosphate reductase alpha chain